MPENKMDPNKPLPVAIEALEIRQELMINNIGSLFPVAERGRTLMKSTAKFPFTFNNVYAICVNGVWYEKALRPDMHDELWKELEK